MHPRCHNPTLVCDSRRRLRVGGINDDPSKGFPLVVGHVATQGA
jgi:hypothetical protein